MGKYSSFIAPTGTNLRSRRIAPEAASEILTATVRFLQEAEPPEGFLRSYADWWEHDGLHFDRGNIDFGELAQMVSTADAMKTAMCGDFRVFFGVAPPNFRWYLRFYHENWLDTEGEPQGAFDITVPDEWLASYRQQVLTPLSAEVEEQESLSYYHSIGMDSYS